MIIHIHSDDMGATKHVTERMLASWREGTLSGFSVLANGAACDLMSAELRANAERPARIACHLNLSEGPSAAPASSVPLLVDENGQLKHTFGSLIVARLRYGKTFVQQVAIEWQAQIAKAAALVAPRKLAAVDGHMHIHMLPFLFPTAARLAREQGIPEIRISREPLFLAARRDAFTAAYAINLVKNLTLGACSALATRSARRENLASPDQLVGVLYTGDMRLNRALSGLKAAEKRNAKSVEVMFHVGRAAESEHGRWEGRDFIAKFYFAQERDAEFVEASRLASTLNRDGAAFHR